MNSDTPRDALTIASNMIMVMIAPSALQPTAALTLALALTHVSRIRRRLSAAMICCEFGQNQANANTQADRADNLEDCF